MEQYIAFRFKTIRRYKPTSDSGEYSETTSDSSTNRRKQLKRNMSGALPQIPEGETEETFKDHCKKVEKEMTKKKGKNMTLIKEIMDCTYAMRRREILNEIMPVDLI